MQTNVLVEVEELCGNQWKRGDFLLLLQPDLQLEQGTRVLLQLRSTLLQEIRFLEKIKTIFRENIDLLCFKEIENNSNFELDILCMCSIYEYYWKKNLKFLVWFTKITYSFQFDIC